MAPFWFDKFAAASVEAGLSALLDLDPSSRAEARALAGKQLALILEPGPVSMTLCFRDSGLEVAAGAIEDADAVLRLDPAAAARLLAEGAEAVGAGGVVIRGDTGLATATFEWLRNLRPDLLAPLGRWLGPESTHVLSESARRASNRVRWGIRSGFEATRAGLTGPGGLLPERVEVARFLDEVDDLAMALDRLEARVQRLRGRPARSGKGAGRTVPP